MATCLVRTKAVQKYAWPIERVGRKRRNRKTRTFIGILLPIAVWFWSTST